MASVTKKAIVASFMKLCTKKSLDKITVRDIVDDCEINRNTFYYYFQDIYALIDEVFLDWTDDFRASCGTKDDLTEALIALAESAHAQRRLVVNLSISLDGTTLEDYWLRATSDAWREWVRRAGEGVAAGEDAVRYVAHTVAIGVFAMFRRWIRGGMKEEPVQIVRHYTATWLSMIESALTRYENEFESKRKAGKKA